MKGFTLAKTPFPVNIVKRASHIQEVNLKHHEKIHTGEKPFDCKYVAKSLKDQI